MSVRPFAGSLVFACLAASCAGGAPSSPGQEERVAYDGPPPIVTDQSSYTVRRKEVHLPDGRLYGRFVEFSIVLRYTNPLRGPIYLPTCRGVNPPSIEKKDNQRWLIAFSPIVLACLGPPKIIEPGRTFEFTYHVEAALPGFNVMPEFNTTVPGTYRVVWGGYSLWHPSGAEPGLGVELPLSVTISNEFELQESAN
ncbi:MAG TPA: hypothetical protein VE282_06055 [Gemmatimonadales bacterium]|jgi:hypothetical protein|nr:hypothetical protein [Gemmatimonadales bacterium]